MAKKIKRLPRYRQSSEINKKNGRVYRFEVDIEQGTLGHHEPDGIKCTFRIFRETAKSSEEFQLVYMIDNHDPRGFHEHPKEEVDHAIYNAIPVGNYEEAWRYFELKCQEYLNEP